MKRTLNDGASSAGALPHLTSNPFAHIPLDVMPNIWSRLPEEALAALLCADRYLYGLPDAKEARREQREVILTLRPRFGEIANGRSASNAQFERALNLCMKPMSNEAVRARSLAVISKNADKKLFLLLNRRERSSKFFTCLRTLNKHLQAQVLETMYCDFIWPRRVKMPADFANFLRLFGGEERQLDRALSEIVDLPSLSPGHGTAFKLWLLHWIGYEADKNTADPAISFAALLSHITDMQDAELVEALPWLPAFCQRDLDELDIDDDEYMFATTAKGSAHLMQIYFDRCASLEPALAVKIHLTSMETMFLTHDSGTVDWVKPKVVAEGIMQSMLHLKEKALVVAMQELLHRHPLIIDEPDTDPVALCLHIQESVSEGKAALMVELLKVVAFSKTSHEGDGPYFNFAEGNGAGAVELREIFAMCLALPSQDLSADALAMFSCVLAYMPSSELQLAAVDWLIEQAKAKATSEHLSLLVLLAHLSPLLDRESSSRLQTMVKSTALDMPPAERHILYSAISDAVALASICSCNGLSMKSLYPSLYCLNTISFQAQRDLDEILNHILSSAQREQFIASIFVQLHALGDWPKFESIAEDIRRRDGGVQNKAGLRSDAEPQSVTSKLARMASPAMHMEYLSNIFDTKGFPYGVYYVMEMVLRKPLSQVSAETARLRAHVKFLHELSMKLGNNADSVLKECIDAGVVANNAQGLTLLKHWKPLLPSLTREDRHRILMHLASICFQTEAPPSTADLVFINTMIDMASLLRDGDKLNYLRTLLVKVNMPPCEEREEVFRQISAISSSLPKEFADRIDPREIVLLTDSERIRLRVLQHQRGMAPLTPVQVRELIAAAGLDRRLNEEQVRIVVSAMSESNWNKNDVEKLEPEHWTALLRAFEQQSAEVTQALTDATPFPVVAEHAIDYIGAHGHAQTILGLDDEEIDINGFAGVDFQQEWPANDMQ